MFNMFGWTSLLAGLYMIMVSIMMSTKNFRSTIFFKFIPLILGCGSIGSALKLFDIIALKL